MKRRAPLFAVLAVLVLTAGWWFLLYSPKADEQAAYELETTELVAQAQQLTNEVAELEAIKADELTYEAELARLDQYLPLDPQQPALLESLQLAADAAGVEITDFTVGEALPVVDAPAAFEPDRVLVEIPVSMTLDGGYFQLVDLLRRLEVDVDRAVMVDTVALAEGEDGFPSLTGTWSGRMFAIMPVEQAPAPATTEPADGETDGSTPDGTSSEAPAEGATEAPAPSNDAVQADGAGQVTS
jgi:Tfp pilus assembly protein PilO